MKARRTKGRTTVKASWPTTSVCAPVLTGDQGTDDACATMKCRHASGEADEKRQCIDRECKDQPAEQADPEHVEDESDDKHGGGSAARTATVAPSTTTTARPKL